MSSWRYPTAATSAFVFLAGLAMYSPTALALRTGCDDYYRVHARAVVQGRDQDYPELVERVNECMLEEARGRLDWTHTRPTPAESPEQPREMSAIYPDLDAYDALILAEARRQELDPDLVKAVVLVESAFNARAVSVAGAQGLMQLMPGTAGDLGVTDAFDAGQNIRGGTTYLREMLIRFGGDLDLALAAYNAGPHVVERCLCVPENGETPDYVRNVNRFYTYFSQERPVGRLL